MRIRKNNNYEFTGDMVNEKDTDTWNRLSEMQ